MKLILPLSILVFFITRGINMPYVGPNATSSNIFSLAARNYVKFGYWQARFVPITSPIESLSQEHSYYLNHPQLLPIIESFLFRLFGEDFWVGRLTEILPSVGTLLLIYLIAKRLFDTRVAFFSLLIAALIPATSVFGKMIAQEPLTLFFVLMNLYLVLLYLKKRKTLYLSLILIFTVLGTLSDWPMIYFSLLSAGYLYYRKIKRSAFLIAFTSLATEIIFLIYVAYITGGLSGLNAAIFNRSLGQQLLSISFWPLIWIATLLLRFVLYYNPLFISFTLLLLIKVAQEIISRKKITLTNYVLLILFLQGFLYVILFPEGSFSHAYWIYYFIPIVSISSGYYMIKIWKSKRFLALTVFVLSFIFLYKVTDWKTKQSQSNLWRYDLAKSASSYLVSYQKIIINPNSVIDADMLEYQFSIPVVVDSDLPKTMNFSKYLYSCYEKCSEDEARFASLSRSYHQVIINTRVAQVFIFDLSERTDNPKIVGEKWVEVRELPYEYNTIKAMYSSVKNLLKVPQI